MVWAGQYRLIKVAACRVVRPNLRSAFSVKVCLVPLVLLVLAAPVFGQNTWTGASNQFWNNAANWSSGTVANGSTDISIQQNGPVNGDFSFTNNHTLNLGPVQLNILSTTTLTNSGFGTFNLDGT